MLSGEGLYILCEGNFQYGNATLTYYDPATQGVENEVFYRANGMKLGDVAQSMTVYDGKGWIVVNNSHVVFAIDPSTGKEIGRIENLTSPRYMSFVNDEKAYISQIWDNRIFIVNPKTYQISGYIEVPGMPMGTGSTEMMVKEGKYVYCSCWSYQNRIIRIDTETDSVDGEVIVGIQPKSLVKDCNGRLWTMTDGGYEGSPYGHEAPKLVCIDPVAMQIVKEFLLKNDDNPLALTIDKEGRTLYWINRGVYRMDVSSERLPVAPIIESQDTKYFGLTLSEEGEIYLADAIDYQQNGIIYRFTPDGRPLDMFYVGVNPGAFCWK